MQERKPAPCLRDSGFGFTLPQTTATPDSCPHFAFSRTRLETPPTQILQISLPTFPTLCAQQFGNPHKVVSWHAVRHGSHPLVMPEGHNLRSIEEIARLSRRLVYRGCPRREASLGCAWASIINQSLQLLPSLRRMSLCTMAIIATVQFALARRQGVSILRTHRPSAKCHHASGE